MHVINTLLIIKCQQLRLHALIPFFIIITFFFCHKTFCFRSLLIVLTVRSLEFADVMGELKVHSKPQEDDDEEVIL